MNSHKIFLNAFAWNRSKLLKEFESLLKINENALQYEISFLTGEVTKLSVFFWLRACQALLLCFHQSFVCRWQCTIITEQIPNFSQGNCLTFNLCGKCICCFCSHMAITTWYLGNKEVSVLRRPNLVTLANAWGEYEISRYGKTNACWVENYHRRHVTILCLFVSCIWFVSIHQHVEKLKDHYQTWKSITYYRLEITPFLLPVNIFVFSESFSSHIVLCDVVSFHTSFS